MDRSVSLGPSIPTWLLYRTGQENDVILDRLQDQNIWKEISRAVHSSIREG